MSNNTYMPDESGLRSHLSGFRGATAFEIPTTDRAGRTMGNHGDALMLKVYRDIAEDTGITFTSSVEMADILVVPPSGALLENYSFPAILRERLTSYPDIPLLIFPSSTLFQKKDPAFIFEGRKAPTTLLLREEHSYRQLETHWSDSLAACNVTIALDHDVVASGHERIPSILKEAVNKPPTNLYGSLVVARLDIEARIFPQELSDIPRKKQAMLGIYRRLPTGLRNSLRKRVVAQRQLRENQLLIQRVYESRAFDTSKTIKMTPNSKDISDPGLVSFSDYAQSLLGATQVITNRLHVALPATALGIETYLMDTGYHKLRGVYERSLTKNSNVHLIPYK